MSAPTAFSDVEALLARMTLDEKIGQMTQLDLMTVTDRSVRPIRLDEEKLREAVVTYGIGSFFNTGVGFAMDVADWNRVQRTIQDMIREETPNRIPLLFGIDSIHGATFVREATLFPQQVAMGATRNPELMRRASEVSARETRAAGLRWAFAPVLDVGRNALWSRLPETFGEDPYLVSTFGVAAVEGLEGENVAGCGSVASCIKHYIGYSVPVSGKDRSPALIPEAQLREYYLPPFQAAVRAGAKTVMLNSGEVNGIPGHANKYLINDVLRGELGFDGVVVSDWEDVIRLHTWHKTAETPAEAVRQAIDAGLDMSMVPLDFSFFHLLKELVTQGKVSEQRIDESVRRILRLKAEVGLFENPYPEPEAVAAFGKSGYRELAVEAATEALTLLKNESGTLPFAKDVRVLVAGPAATSLGALHGCWSYSWLGWDEDHYPPGTPTLADAIASKFGSENVTVHRGVEFNGLDIDAEAAVTAAAQADVVVLCLGENSYAETPGDINDLDLPQGQQDFALRLYATGKPVVLVLLEGRGRVIREIEQGAAAILMAYWPGGGGAQAIADVLAGDANPSGKLPFTYARHSNNLVTYDRKFTSAVTEISAPGDIKLHPSKPQWEFGHGLSYTTFEISNLRLSSDILRPGEALTVSIDVKNTGARAGKETVELYTSDLFASTTPAGKRLRAFTKISLEPGGRRTVTFALTPADLAFVDAGCRTITEPGEFDVLIGGLTARFRYEAA